MLLVNDKATLGARGLERLLGRGGALGRGGSEDVLKETWGLLRLGPKCAGTATARAPGGGLGLDCAARDQSLKDQGLRPHKGGGQKLLGVSKTLLASGGGLGPAVLLSLLNHVVNLGLVFKQLGVHKRVVEQ